MQMEADYLCREIEAMNSYDAFMEISRCSWSVYDSVIREYINTHIHTYTHTYVRTYVHTYIYR